MLPSSRTFLKWNGCCCFFFFPNWISGHEEHNEEYDEDDLSSLVPLPLFMLRPQQFCPPLFSHHQNKCQCSFYSIHHESQKGCLTCWVFQHRLCLLPSIHVIHIKFIPQGWGCSSAVELLPSLCEALRSILNTEKKLYSSVISWW